MIEFQYDEKTYRRMSVRISWWVYAVLLGFVVAVFAWISSIYIEDCVNGETTLTYTLIVLLVFLAVLVAIFAVFIVTMRKQMSKSFAMYSANGVVRQTAEITDEEIVVTNLSRQNVTRILRRDIASVKKYKIFFVIVTNTKVKLAVPFNVQTQLLYDVLTGAATLDQLPTKPTAEQELLNAEQSTQQPAPPVQTDALSFEYEITEPQSVSMLTKIISIRYRVFIVAFILFSIIMAGLIIALVVNYIWYNQVVTSYAIFVAICVMLLILLSVVYGSKNKSGRTSGSNYFHQQAKDGKCILRAELYDQGIVAVNVLRDTRTAFRFADMERVRLFADFFCVEFKSKEFLPIPLTEDTRKLYEILNNGVSHK